MVTLINQMDRLFHWRNCIVGSMPNIYGYNSLRFHHNAMPVSPANLWELISNAQNRPFQWREVHLWVVPYFATGKSRWVSIVSFGTSPFPNPQTPSTSLLFPFISSASCPLPLSPPSGPLSLSICSSSPSFLLPPFFLSTLNSDITIVGFFSLFLHPFPLINGLGEVGGF